MTIDVGYLQIILHIWIWMENYKLMYIYFEKLNCMKSSYNELK